MKILQINSRVNVGSASRITEQIGIAILNSGNDSYIAVGRDSGESQSKVIRIGGKLSVGYHWLMSRLFGSHGCYSRLATQKLIKEIIQINPDVIHLHNIHGYYINYELLFSYLNQRNTPVVWTFHDCWPFTGHCAHFINANCTLWKTGCNRCPLKKSYPTSILFDNVSGNYHKKKWLFSRNDNLHIVTVSNWLGEVVSESFLQSKSLQTIYNGIDVRLFTPGESTIANNIKFKGKFIVMGLATAWSNAKGLNDYNKLAELLSENELIVLVGVNDETAKFIDGRICCIPRTRNINDLVQLYRIADVVTSLSYAETFGLTIAEAQACGTPVVVYDNTAQPELVSEGTGYIVPTGSVQEVYNAINKIKKLGKHHFSDNCVKHAQTNFDCQKQYRKYIDLYESICK